MRILQSDQHELWDGLVPIRGRIADFRHAVDVSFLELSAQLVEKLVARRRGCRTVSWQAAGA